MKQEALDAGSLEKTTRIFAVVYYGSGALYFVVELASRLIH